MNTDDLIAQSRTRFEHTTARRVLKEKYQAKMLFAHAGGMWQAGPELQATIFTSGKIGEVVLLDLYETPVKVDATELIALSQQRWQEQMTAWLLEYEKLNQQR